MADKKSEKHSTNQTKVHGYFVQLQPNMPDAEISLIESWRLVMRYKTMIIAIVFVLTAISIVVVLLMRPVYRSVVLLAPATVENVQGGIAALAGQLGGIVSLAGLSSSGSNLTEEAIAILTSRSFTKQFISKENLMPILFSDEWDEVNGQWDVNDPDNVPSDEDAYRLFNEDVRAVNAVKKSEMITLSIEWYDRDLAAEWANRLVWQLNQYLRSRDIAEAQKSIEFLNQELSKSNTVELRQGVSNLIERQIETVMLANVREQYAFRVLDPAVASDVDKRVRPKRKIIVITSFIIAFLIAMLAAVVRYQIENGVNESSSARVS